MTRVLIIEDEQLAAKKLVRLLEKCAPKITVVQRLGSVAEAVAFLAKNTRPIDLVFLDIHLGDGNCFEIFEQVTLETPIIFTTAYDQYAIQAFQQNSVDYLLKPIDVGDLTKAVEKAARRKEEKNRAAKIETLLYNFRNRDQKIALPTLDGLIFIELKGKK